MFCRHADINECVEGTDNCDLIAECVDTDGSFTCICPEGTEGSGNGILCTSKILLELSIHCSVYKGGSP